MPLVSSSTSWKDFLMFSVCIVETGHTYNQMQLRSCYFFNNQTNKTTSSFQKIKLIRLASSFQKIKKYETIFERKSSGFLLVK